MGEVIPTDIADKGAFEEEKQYFELLQPDMAVFKDYRQKRLENAAVLANALTAAIYDRDEVTARRLTKELKECFDSFQPTLTPEENEQIFQLARLKIDSEFNGNLKREEQ